MLRTEPDASRGAPAGGARAQRWSVVALQAVADGPLVAEGEADDGAFDPQRSYLLGRFRAFYAELNHAKRAALRGAGSLTALTTELAVPQDPHDLALEASRRLQHVLEQLALESAVQTGEYGAKRFREAQYAMAALADEMFLHTEWSGREAWLGTMLESALFGTQIAGEEIFKRIDALLGVRTGAAVDLATVYFMILGLGFEGRYRGSDGSVLGGYRLRLYRFIYRREAGGAGETLVPQAYAHTLAGSRAPRLPLVRRWAIILGVTAAAYLVASQLIWRNRTSELRTTSQEILDVAATSQRGTQ
jgi:type VI secretion system protein ImpK